MVNDNVNSPSHYTQSAIECIEAIKSATGEGFSDYCQGNIIKYVWRYKQKNGVEDLKKCQWYLRELIKSEEEKMGKEKINKQTAVG
tara:strand:+ start:585 stop:842 length:258 start_codon:yes stop_codon:yes gene_type:complete